MGYYYHAVPGSLMVKTQALKNNPKQAEHLAIILAGLSGVLADKHKRGFARPLHTSKSIGFTWFLLWKYGIRKGIFITDRGAQSAASLFPERRKGRLFGVLQVLRSEQRAAGK